MFQMTLTGPGRRNVRCIFAMEEIEMDNYSVDIGCSDRYNSE